MTETTPDPKAMRTSLDQANDQLDHSMDDGSVEHEHFLKLLGQLARHRAVAMRGNAPMAASLAHDLAAFEARLPKRYSDHWHTAVSEI